MNRIIRTIRRHPEPRRLNDLTRAWGDYTARGIVEYESARTSHSHALQRLAQEAQR
jgi:hypothetical protein